MQPRFRITADDQDVTAAIAVRLIKLRLTDEAGLESDELSITLENTGAGIAPPRRGVILRLSLGYAGSPLIDMGAYTVDEVELEGPPSQITIRGHGIDWASAMKALRDESREDITVGELVENIAATTNRIARVSTKVAETRVQMIIQRGESAVHLLSRLGRQYGFTLTGKNDELIAIETAPETTVSGKPIPTRALDVSDLTSWRVREADRDAVFGSVVASFYDFDVGDQVNVIAGSGEPVRVLKRGFASDTEARRGAESELARVGRRGGALDFTKVGDPLLKAETRVNMSGLGQLGDGLWVIERAEHELTDQGYRTRVDGGRL